MKSMKKQAGFTIIELVVVILLLGILTATALPRFMDVTDEAHDAVVNGVLAGLQTGNGLFRAQWMATGQPTGVADFDSLNANATGYPIGKSGLTLDTNADCVEIFQTLLQPSGRPDIAALNSTSGAALAVDNTETSGSIVSANDFVARRASSSLCQFVYVGQFKKATAGGLPVIEFDPAAGTVKLGSEL